MHKNKSAFNFRQIMNPNIQKLKSLLISCTLCPNRCKVNRIKGEKGICKLGDKIMISSVHLHFGEEPELVGNSGSGTIFFTGCNMKCIFCQNYDISWEMNGAIVSEENLAECMMRLQLAGANNINLVTPTPQVPMIFDAIERARNNGLRLPVVYNCGGYESIEVLKLLKGLVDIYMPDFKYGNNINGKKLSGVENYFDIVKPAIREMHNQVGDLVLDQRGVAVRGLLIRHLVLPDDLAASKNVLDFIAKEISANTYINILNQYHPAYKAHEHKQLINKNISKEYLNAIEYARSIGLHRGFNN